MKLPPTRSKQGPDALGDRRAADRDDAAAQNGEPIGDRLQQRIEHRLGRDGLCSKLCSGRVDSRRIGRHRTELGSRDIDRKSRVLACFVRA
jgi:hypothetical protein